MRPHPAGELLPVDLNEIFNVCSSARPFFPSSLLDSTVWDAVHGISGAGLFDAELFC